MRQESERELSKDSVSSKVWPWPYPQTDASEVLTAPQSYSTEGLVQVL